ncbi:transcriptional activator haa1 [Pseudogymnoascus australis]
MHAFEDIGPVTVSILSRSAHVKCDCGEKISGKKACTHGEDSEFPPDACCCSHGGRCSCASKKEIFQPVLESDTDENSISMASADKSLPPHDLTLSSIDPLTPFANDHQMPLYPETEMAVAGGLSFVVPGIGLNYASQSSLTNPSTDDHSSLSTIGTRLSFPHLQGPLANSHQEPNLASLTNMEHRPHQSIEGQVPPYKYLGFENPSDSFNYPLDFDNLASMAEIDQPTSMSIDWSHYDV